jgi:hypothetical protein
MIVMPINSSVNVNAARWAKPLRLRWMFEELMVSPWAGFRCEVF